VSALKHNVADLVWKSPGSGIEIISLEMHLAVSELYVIRVLIKSDDAGLDFQKMLHSEAEITLKCGEELSENRPLTGIITRFSQQRTRFGNLPNASGKRYLYEVEVRPMAWLLTRQYRSKVFQKMDVKEIVSEVLDGHGIAHQWNLQGSPPKRPYTVQYEETDYTFVSRLLEAEGICFFFDQEQRKMMFADHPGGHTDCKPKAEAMYVEEVSPRFQYGKQEFIRDFTYEEAMGAGSFVLNHYNYETSQTNIRAEATQDKVPGFAAMEHYEHTQNYEDKSMGEYYAGFRGEEEIANAKRGIGHTSCRSFDAGFTMSMSDHFRGDLNGSWLILSCSISMEQGSYRCRFTAIPADVPYRPPRKTPKPKVLGLQTATVTGPAGAKVYLDELGRCKLQFHWDREGEKDERSSMWVRVSNNYAGKDYGIQWIPRIGHEVLVTFVNGDPDLPIVTGRVYNDFNTPPLGPAEKWQNIIKTIKDNHIMFDDKDGNELIDIRAEKDMKTLVVHDDTQDIGNNRQISVGSNHSESIGKNMSIQVGQNLTEQVGQNYMETVGVNYVTTVGAMMQTTVGAAQSITVGQDRQENVGKSKSVKTGKKFTLTAGDSIDISGKKDGAIELKDELIIKVGGAKALLKKNGDILLEGKKINIKASGPIKIKGSKIEQN
jgi:type VI secretion system secreted protein VgrG